MDENIRKMVIFSEDVGIKKEIDSTNSHPLLYSLRNMVDHYISLSETYPSIRQLIQKLKEKLVDVNILTAKINRENILKKRQAGEYSEEQDSFLFRHALGEVVAMFQIMNYAISRSKEGHPEYAEELTDERMRKLLSDLVTIMEKKDFLPEIYGQENNIEKFIRRIEDREALYASLENYNSMPDIEMCLNRTATAAREVKTMLDKIPLPDQEKAKDRLTKAMWDCIQKLKRDAAMTVDKDGRITDECIHWVSRLIACRQLMLQEQERKNPLSNKAAEGKEALELLSEEQVNARINVLAVFLENSKFIKSALQSGDDMQNLKNLLEILEHEDKYARRLNELPYAHRQISDLENSNVIREKTDNDISVITRMEEERARYLNTFEDGYYDIGSKAFADTKNEMRVLGSLLVKYAHDSYLEKVATTDFVTAEKVKTLLDDLNDLSRLLGEQSVKVFDESSLDRDNTDRKDLSAITEKYDAVIADMDSLMLEKVSDDDRFQKLYSDIFAGRRRIDEITEGNLFVPADDIKYENGREIRRINYKDEVPGGLKPETTFAWDLKMISDDIITEGKGKIKSIEIRMEDAGKELFAHDPCPADIVQGDIGDCYFVSTLMAIAARNPQTIRDMFSYNEKDNTVTIRFFDPQNKPTYVTVDNTLPVFRQDLGEGKFEESRGISRGAKWVALMEKAFMASGLRSEYYEPPKDAPSIEGGLSVYVMNLMFGPQMGKYEKMAVMEQKFFRIKDADEPIFPEKYEKEDEEFYQKLKNLYESGYPLTCDIGHAKKVAPIALPQGHAYGIVGFTEENGFKYIYVKNPHALWHREYDENRNPIRVDDKKNFGLSKIELRDFLNNFEAVTTADFNRRPIDYQLGFEVEKYRILYRETVKDMNNVLLSVKKDNMPLLQNLCTQSALAQSSLENREIHPDELTHIMMQYFDAARDYLQFRDNNLQSRKAEESQDAVKSYYAASMITRLEKRFLENEMTGLDHAQLIEEDQLIKEVLSPTKKDSPARTAAISKIKTLEKEKAKKEKPKKEKAKKEKAQKEKAKKEKNKAENNKEEKTQEIAGNEHPFVK